MNTKTPKLPEDHRLANVRTASASSNTSGNTSDRASDAEATPGAASTSNNLAPTTGCGSMATRITSALRITDDTGRMTMLGLLVGIFDVFVDLVLALFLFSIADLLPASHSLACSMIGATWLITATIKTIAPAIGIANRLSDLLASSSRDAKSIAPDSTRRAGTPQ